MEAEICGDGQLTVAQRMLYLAMNLKRNFGLRSQAVPRESFCGNRMHRTPSAASPSRTLTEAFFCERLPKMLPYGKIRVLEIGCGSGSLAFLLDEIGYSGTYVGVDVADSFDRTTRCGFERSFVLTDANCYEANSKYDLVVSVSALEHIANDRLLIPKLRALVAPGGLQLHFIPSGWGLPVYLWHGYRQYTAPALAELFDPRQATFFAMGGLPSFIFHFLFITVGEILLKLKLRWRLPRLYARLRDRCLELDRFAPFCATMYAVYQPNVANPEGFHD